MLSGCNHVHGLWLVAPGDPWAWHIVQVVRSVAHTRLKVGTKHRECPPTLSGSRLAFTPKSGDALPPGPVATSPPTPMCKWLPLSD
jgi:hypothetical protein